MKRKVKLGTIEDGWDSYRRVIPADAHSTQVIETRRAFYAGAGAVLDVLMRISQPDVADDAGIAHLTEMHLEIDEFLARLKAGVA